MYQGLQSNVLSHQKSMRQASYPHFTDGEIETQELRNLFKISWLARGGATLGAAYRYIYL